MLYRHTHLLFEQTLARPQAVDLAGPTFRVVPSDGDTPDGHHSFVVWTTLLTRSTGERESDPPVDPRKMDGEQETKPDADTTARTQLLVEVSADRRLWLPLDPHTPREPARVIRVPFMLPFVRARLVSRDGEVEARAMLIGAAAFTLQKVVDRTAVVVVGRS